MFLSEAGDNSAVRRDPYDDRSIGLAFDHGNYRWLSEFVLALASQEAQELPIFIR